MIINNKVWEEVRRFSVNFLKKNSATILQHIILLHLSPLSSKHAPKTLGYIIPTWNNNYGTQLYKIKVTLINYKIALNNFVTRYL